MESELIALATASEEAGWLRNLLLDTPLWEKSIPAVLIHCDSTAAIAKVHLETGSDQSVGRSYSPHHLPFLISWVCFVSCWISTLFPLFLLEMDFTVRWDPFNYSLGIEDCAIRISFLLIKD